MRNIGPAGLVPQNCDTGNKWIHFDVSPLPSRTRNPGNAGIFHEFSLVHREKSNVSTHLPGNRADFVRILLRLNPLSPVLRADVTRSEKFVYDL